MTIDLKNVFSITKYMIDLLYTIFKPSVLKLTILLIFEHKKTENCYNTFIYMYMYDVLNWITVKNVNYFAELFLKS